MKTKTTLWDAAEHLKTKEDMAAYIACALEEGDSALIAAALGDIARAQGMTKIAKKKPDSDVRACTRPYPEREIQSLPRF